MHKYRLLAVGALLLGAAGAAQAISVDELIAKNAAARGGLDKIQAIKTLKMEGHLRFTGGFGSIELGYVTYKKAPDALRTEATVQGLTQVQAWDGKEAWQISPFQGRKDPERLSADDAKPLADDAPINGSLLDYAAKGSKVEYQGTEDVDGTDAHKIKVALKTGDTEYVYLDPDSFLEIRVVGTRKLRGTESTDITDFGDYEQVNGVYFPFSSSTRSKDGGGGEQQVTIEKAEANIPLDDSEFAFPAKAAK
jgi:outer membrane lipoprotein-sorting protein